MDVEPVGGKPGEMTEVSLLEMPSGKATHVEVVAAYARNLHFRVVEGEVNDRNLPPPERLHEGDDLGIVAQRYENTIAFPALGLACDAVEDRQLPAVLPRVARYAGEPGMVGRSDEYEDVAALHRGVLSQKPQGKSSCSRYDYVSS